MHGEGRDVFPQSNFFLEQVSSHLIATALMFPSGSHRGRASSRPDKQEKLSTRASQQLVSYREVTKLVWFSR